jgi:hypothetical protein
MQPQYQNLTPEERESRESSIIRAKNIWADVFPQWTEAVLIQYGLTPADIGLTPENLGTSQLGQRVKRIRPSDPPPEQEAPREGATPQ